ncbi:hypothetical protein E3N88_41293 [Mikania micrantha]|uniref:Uncharacterized protein n=1 Tax=Mikania micrantha TaxID=192012 RepID=A0A5N6LQ93_9ASTR|nr:hypothetical protein E3N88_41293 [Mikania micrantha]
MASKDPSLISNPQEQKWVVEITKILDHQLEIDNENPLVSLFQVPETITIKQPEAYEPQQVGLGPIHHFQPRAYKKMEQKKLAVMRKLVPIVRSCYDMFLEHDDELLTWVFVIDGLFLLNLFHNYNQPELPEVGQKKRLVAQDVLMVENQIPFMVLKEINDALHVTTGSQSHIANAFSPSIFQIFCKIHSPLKLCSESQAPSSVDHLLHYMYYSIVNNFRVRLIAPASVTTEVFNFVKKIPKEEIVQAYEQTISILETFTQTKLIIPSASNLHAAGFKFHSLKEDEGIKDTRVWGKDVYLPIVTLNKDSDVIFKNLVAYEALTSNSNSFPLAEFMVLMCALVVNVDDVKRLENIIKGDLCADEVVKLFTGISGSIPAMKTNKKSNLQGTIDEINMAYNSRLSMKPYLLLKKLAQWLLVALKAIGGFVGSTWKIVAYVVGIVTVFMLTLQAYCDVYGCDKTVTLLPFELLS